MGKQYFHKKHCKFKLIKAQRKRNVNWRRGGPIKFRNFTRCYMQSRSQLSHLDNFTPLIMFTFHFLYYIFASKLFVYARATTAWHFFFFFWETLLNKSHEPFTVRATTEIVVCRRFWKLGKPTFLKCDNCTLNNMHNWNSRVVAL